MQDALREMLASDAGKTTINLTRRQGEVARGMVAELLATMPPNHFVGFVRGCLRECVSDPHPNGQEPPPMILKMLIGVGLAEVIKEIEDLADAADMEEGAI